MLLAGLSLMGFIARRRIGWDAAWCPGLDERCRLE